MANYLPRPVLGVAYYPEQWPEERWLLDAESMRIIGIKVVRMAEFAWNKIEPTPEAYDWDWLDRAIEVMSSQGIKVLLGTPTTAPPPWMAEQHDDMLALTREGKVMTQGGRRFYCPSNSYYRTQVNRIAREMARRYINNYSVIGWQIDNEMGNHGNCRCYCPRCLTRWHTWLIEKYSTLENLNKQWGTVFWSQGFSDWSQIPLPTYTGANYSPSLELDYCRFASDNALEYFDLQVGAIREIWPARRGFITHNMFFGDDHIDIYNLSYSLDFISWDNYPHGMKSASDLAFYHDYMWGMKNDAYWIMEQAVGPVNWTKYNPVVPPGQVRLWTLQNFLKGAQATVYFRWREARFGAEQYHSAFLSHDARHRSVFHEVSQLSEELDALPPKFFRRHSAKVALLFSFEDLWAIQIEPHNVAFDYLEIAKDIHASLVQRHVAVDILPRTTDINTLKNYSLVISPAPILGDPEVAERWHDYVEEGGKLLLITRAGAKEPSNIWSEQSQPYMMHEWMGMRVDENLSFPPYLPGNHPRDMLGSTPAAADVPIALYEELLGRQMTARRLWVERLDPAEGEDILLRYSKEVETDFFAESVAMTRRRLGKGEAFYLGVLPNESTYVYLWDELFGEICQPVAANLPRIPGFEVIKTGEQGDHLALLNHNSHSIAVRLGATYRQQDNTVVDRITLPPYGVVFLKI